MAKNKKHLVLLDLYNHCQKENNFIFHNDLVKDFSKKINSEILLTLQN